MMSAPAMSRSAAIESHRVRPLAWPVSAGGSDDRRPWHRRDAAHPGERIRAHRTEHEGRAGRDDGREEHVLGPRMEVRLAEQVECSKESLVLAICCEHRETAIDQIGRCDTTSIESARALCLVPYVEPVRDPVG